jgi:hypothetical protein
MVRFFSVMAAVALGVAGCAVDTAPYVWPTPTYGVPFTRGWFTVRYNSLWNTQDEVRAVIARYCGAGVDVARVALNPGGDTVADPESLTVWCGSSPQPMPLFRGQDVGVTYLISLKPSDTGAGAPAKP